MTVTITIKLNDELDAMLTDYTNSKGISKSELVQNLIIEKLEDEQDIESADASYGEWIRNGKNVKTFDEMMINYS